MSLTGDIKEFALDLGYSKVGITTADSFNEYIEKLKSRQSRYDFYLEDPRQPLLGAEPKKLMPSAKSIICFVWDYAQKSFPKALVGKIGRIYQGRCYNAPPHRINGARFQLMHDFLRRSGCEVGKGIIIPERWAAARAGVTTFGKNNFAYAEGIGSFVLLGSFIVDAELEYDKPTLQVKCPEGCIACLKACPTQAIYKPNKLDPRRCIAFNAWWTQDGRPCVTSHIPYEIREKMGTRVHGCDVCQEVCTRNQAKLKANLPPDDFLVTVARDFSLAKMLNLTDEFYETRIRPLMYNYIKARKYFQRNAAIALGNVGDQVFIHDLEIAMHDPEELVRGYAAWALGKIGGRSAKQILERCHGREASESVKEEIRLALLAMR